jgi:hypothetical protein
MLSKFYLIVFFLISVSAHAFPAQFKSGFIKVDLFHRYKISLPNIDVNSFNIFKCERNDERNMIIVDAIAGNTKIKIHEVEYSIESAQLFYPNRYYCNDLTDMQPAFTFEFSGDNFKGKFSENFATSPRLQHIFGNEFEFEMNGVIYKIEDIEQY